MKTQSHSSTLNQAALGSEVSIVSITGQGALRQRILDMGLTRGTRVQVLKLAPLGDPMEISLRGYELVLRKEEAKHVLIAVL